MSSEKFRYLKRDQESSEFCSVEELRNHLSVLGINHLIEILWVRAQYDDVLRKILMSLLGIYLVQEDVDKAKKAVNNALDFPDYIRYTENGYDQILDEIKTILESLVSDGKKEFALQIAKHTISRGQSVAENFEDDWDWTSSLEDLQKWVEGVRQ